MKRLIEPVGRKDIFSCLCEHTLVINDLNTQNMIILAALPELSIMTSWTL